MRRVPHVAFCLSLCALSAAVGCAGGDAGDDSAPAACTPGTPGCAPVAGATVQMGSGGATPIKTGSGGGMAIAPAAEKVPCNVATVVSQECTLCHGDKLQAPMALLTLADFHAMSKTDKTKHIYEMIPPRINSTVPAMRMPPVSQPAVSAPDLATLNAWLTAGAQGDANGCAITTKPMSTVGGGTGGAGSVVPPKDDPFAGSSQTKIEYNDPEMKCYNFLAHAQGDKMAKFSVGTTPDLYTNFIFMPPWQGTQYVRSFRVTSDNLDVIHHWLFYKNMAANTDGAVEGSSGAHPDGELMHGWAPGGSDLYLGSEVGIIAPADTSYTLETHHNNKTGAPSPDASGLEVCVTPKVPKYEASLSWLGTDGINGTTATGTCTPTGSEPIHILGVSPHMHTKGTHMKVVITRTGGMEEVFHDHDFDFSDQHSYAEATILMPGESMTTTCTYSAPASFGEGTNDEMCYFFTLYYPKLSLTNGNPVATFIHGPNTCL